MCKPHTRAWWSIGRQSVGAPSGGTAVGGAGAGQWLSTGSRLRC